MSTFVHKTPLMVTAVIENTKDYLHFFFYDVLYRNTGKLLSTSKEFLSVMG